MNKNGQISCEKSVKLKNSETLKLLTTKFGKLQWVQFKSATDKIPVKNLWNLKTAETLKLETTKNRQLKSVKFKSSTLKIVIFVSMNDVNFNYKISPPYYSSPSFLFKFVKS